MATKRIETQLTIKAVDQYSSMLRNMRTVTGRFADGVRTEMSRLQGMRGPLRLIEDFRKQQDVVRRSGAAMEAAREKQRRLLAEIRATRNPTAQMRREFERARATADRLEQQHQQNRRALHGLQVKLREAGVNTGDLAGEQRRLAGALDGATTAFGRQMERMRRLETMQTRIAEARERMDRSLATAANLSFVGNASMMTGRRIMTALSGPVQQAVEFESAMSDVRKVVDFDTPESFAQMSDDILDLSTRIPMAADGLAQIVAAGGQSGIANEELLKFAETAAKIGVAFDISAGQSGDAMASIKTQLGLTVDQTSALFDAINHLSNNMASTAPKVLDFTTRVAADGEVKGFNATETIAFGSAMIAAGVGADVAATSFRNMGKALARGAASTPKQRAAFESLGLSAADVAKRMQEDAVGTTLDVMERINQLPAHLQSSTMSQIFGDEARAITPLINRLDLLRDALGLVSDEQQYLGSAEREYAARAETTANNLQLMRNQMARLGISIGEVVLPPLNDLLEVSQGVIDRMVAWTKEHPKLTKWLVIGAAAVGGLAIAGGALLTAAAGLIGTMAVLRFGLVGLGARAAFAAGNLMGVGGAFRGLTRLPRFALSTLLTPVRWTARLVSRIPWALLTGGKFALSGLVTPIRWAARLIPSIRWASLAGGLRWTSLIRPLSWLGRGALRFIPVIGWATLAGELLWHFLIKPLGWDEYLPSIDWQRIWGAFSWEGWLPEVDWSEFVSAIDWPEWISDVDWSRWLTFEWLTYIRPISWMRFIPNIPWSDWFGFEWSDFLPEWNWNFIGEIDFAGLIKWPEPPDWLKWLMGTEDEPAAPVPTVMDAPGFDQLPADQRAAAATVVSVTQSGPLPTPAHLQELRDYAASLREEIAGIQGEIDNLGQGPMTDTMALPLRQTMDARRRELQEVETELANAEGRAGELTAALQVLDGTEAAPEISTASIDRANEKVARLLSQLRAVPSAGTGATATPKPAGARAGGGPVRMGLPYLVNENTPRSEWFVPSRSGGVLNVGQAQAAFRSHLSGIAPRPVGRNPELARLHRGAQGLRAASLAVLTSSALAAPAAAQPAQAAKPGSGAVTVQIENFTVHVPSGVSDPDAIADLVSDRIGQRVAATMSASFSD